MELELRNGSLPELASISPSERWELEDALDGAQEQVREFNDEELRRWVEEEGKPQAEIAKLVGRSQQRVSQRCAALGLTAQKSRGGRKPVTSPSNSDDEEVIEAEVVEEYGVNIGGALEITLPEVLADEEDHENPRVLLGKWAEYGAWLAQALDEGPLEVESREQRDLVKRETQIMERLARRIRKEVKVNGRA